MGLNPPPAPPSIFTVAIPEETVTVEIPAPLKSMRVTPVPTVPDAVAIPTPAEETVTPPTVNEVAVTTPTVNEVAVITPTLRLDGGEILVENPARPDALDILCYFLVIYEDSIAVLIILNFVSEESVGVANNLTLLPTLERDIRSLGLLTYYKAPYRRF